MNWSEFPFIYSVVGFLGCLGIVWVSKALGRWFLQKREDYYDRP